MSSSLLSLPDELLAHIVDEALGEYAPRFYKQRQDTARALCLVNKRIGAIAQDKIVEATHLEWMPWDNTPAFACSSEMHHKTRHLRLQSPQYEHHSLSPTFLPPFHSLRDLRLVHVHGVQLDQIVHLAELRNLVLVRSGYSASVPLVAPKLARITLFFCLEDVYVPEPNHLLGSVGCPSLRHLYLGRSNRHDSALSTRDLVAQLDNLDVAHFDDCEETATWRRMNLDDATLDKVLFDCTWYETSLLDEDTSEPRHVRLHDFGKALLEEDIDYVAQCCCGLSECLTAVWPNLRTLYLPRALNARPFNLKHRLLVAVRDLRETCSAAGIEVVFEHDNEDLGDGELRESPHFAARCRRLKAERAAEA